jgi:polysaccharide biosynthesis PFTS motif protein
LSDRVFSAHIVGAFDVVDDNGQLPSFGRRSIGVFDIEPTASTFRWTMAGYILPGFTEVRIVQFWEHLLAAAKAHDLVLVHKPKRAANLRQEWRYRTLLAEAAREGRYVELPPETGPVRLLANLPASIILPFTSVGDLAFATGVKAAFLDPEGSIAHPENHAGGMRVVSGDAELNAWLASIFGTVNGRPRALTQS